MELPSATKSVAEKDSPTVSEFETEAVFPRLHASEIDAEPVKAAVPYTENPDPVLTESLADIVDPVTSAD